MLRNRKAEASVFLMTAIGFLRGHKQGKLYVEWQKNRLTKFYFVAFLGNFAIC